jgi:hypothetical protein
MNLILQWVLFLGYLAGVYALLGAIFHPVTG